MTPLKTEIHLLPTFGRLLLDRYSSPEAGQISNQCASLVAAFCSLGLIPLPGDAIEVPNFEHGSIYVESRTLSSKKHTAIFNLDIR